MRLLLFDIDGTLISVERRASRSMLRRVIEEVFELSIPQEFDIQLGGKTDYQIMTETAQKLNLPVHVVEEKRQHIHDLLTERTAQLASTATIRMLEGVKVLLQECSECEDIALALLTGNLETTAYLKLRPHGLDVYFPTGAFGSDHTDRAMLPPIAWQRAQEHYSSIYGYTLQFHAKNTLIIGDTLNDIRCAKAHGIKTLAVATGPHSTEELYAAGAEFVVENFADVRTIMDIVQYF
ncbi:MAG: HAD hydrolase-like protein [Bacteroidota bacterium]|nr:HAD hydrolase-like protein [Candidatus Kapabacteria bacterium]MDW8219607.1 HAD hydrolase-like protein [Bacteroidota bacterium]